MMWDPETLADASRVLFGRVDAQGMAEVLAVGDRTIRRWLSGDETPRDPSAILGYLRLALEARCGMADDVIRRITAAMEES